MDALMAALVAALLTHGTDRTGWTAALLGDRHRRPLAVALAVVAALAVTNMAAAIGGSLIAPVLSLNAKALLLGVSLVAGGLGAFFAGKRPDSYAGYPGGAFFGSVFGLLLLAFSDRAAFITLALATRTPVPALAAIGATLGGSVIGTGFALAGEHGRRQLPMTAIRVVTGLILTFAGIVAALSGLRLI